MHELPDLNPRDDGLKHEATGSGGEIEDRVAAIRAAVEQSLEDVKAGRVTDLDAAFDRIETMLDEIEAAKRR
jgi:hypothetical protein